MRSPSHSKTAVVIGSGLGGLAAGIRLQARGYSTTLLEMRDRPGGRASVFEKDGFVFDTGPTIITAPFLIDELFALHGKRTSDYLQLVSPDPFYRIIFHDGKTFDYRGSEGAILEQIQKFNPRDVDGYRAFMNKTERIFERAFVDLADQPFTHFSDMLKVAPDLALLRAHESVHRLAARYIQDPCLRQVFSFHPLFVGGHPFRASAVYAMIHFLERKWGVHFCMGGTGALVNALVRLFTDMGGTLRLNSRVTQILVRDRRATGVRLEPGAELPAEVVVSNGDLANTYLKLIEPQHRRHWTDRKIQRMHYSMSLFMIFFGTNRTYPELSHHTIFMGPRYQELLDDIFNRKVLADDFSLYLHAPTRTDPSLGPPGCDSFYVLAPVPNLGATIDWETRKESYADSILASLEKHCPNLRQHIVTKTLFTPLDFEQQLDAYLGSGFQFEPLLTQSAWFRPHNQSEDIAGLYFVGAGTHPGAGVPGVLASAKVMEKLLPV